MAIKESQSRFHIASRSALCRRKYASGICKAPPFVAAMPAPDLSQVYLNNFNLRPHLNHNQVRLCSPMCPAATFYTSCSTADTSLATLNLPRHHQSSESLASTSHAQNQVDVYSLQQTTFFLHFFARACIPSVSLDCLSLRLEGLVLQHSQTCHIHTVPSTVATLTTTTHTQAKIDHRQKFLVYPSQHDHLRHVLGHSCYMCRNHRKTMILLVTSSK